MPHRRETLPQRRYSETFDLRHGSHRLPFQVTLGHYPDGRVGEVFITGAKAGSEVEANVRDTAILVSLLLQHGVPVEAMRSAITREVSGAPSTIIGAVLDRIGGLNNGP